MIGALILIAVVGIVIWSQVGVSQAEPEPLAAVKADDRIVITDDSAGIVLAPADGAGDVGLVFVPGGKVDSWAYARSCPTSSPKTASRSSSPSRG